MEITEINFVYFMKDMHSCCAITFLVSEDSSPAWEILRLLNTAPLIHLHLNEVFSKRTTSQTLKQNNKQ